MEKSELSIATQKLVRVILLSISQVSIWQGYKYTNILILLQEIQFIFLK